MMGDHDHFKIFAQLEGNDVDLERSKTCISMILGSSDTGSTSIKEYFDKFDFINEKQTKSVEIAKSIKKHLPSKDFDSHKTTFKLDFNQLKRSTLNNSDNYIDSCSLINENELKIIDNKLEELTKKEIKSFVEFEKFGNKKINEVKNAPDCSPCRNVIKEQTELEFPANENIETNIDDRFPDFVTSKQKYIEDMKKKGLVAKLNPGKKTLGGRVGVSSKFIPPLANENNSNQKSNNSSAICDNEKLRNIDPDMAERINSEILEIFQPVDWDDIAGLEYVKSTVKEAVVLPMLRPDLFTGLRKPPRGILLFGPPGTGKTLIGKCIASQSKSTFFSISASSLTSKWIGDGEKMIRTLFAVASARSPSVIFIDEIDSLLCQRSETEHESSRRMKTEFLVQLDGAATSDEERILIVGATNRPQELDEAARRRLVRRLYIPLPDFQARIQILQNLCKTVKNTLIYENFVEISNMTEGFSGADMKTLCSDASMEPLRSIPFEEIQNFDERNLRPLNFVDFQTVLKKIRPSVSSSDLQQYIQWDGTYGSGNR